MSRTKTKTSSYKRVLVISDLHGPFEHPDTIKFLTKLKSTYKFDLIISSGDEVDNHAISFHKSNPDLPSPGDELKQARKFIAKLAKLFPKMVILESNHGSLVYRKQLDAGLPRDVFKDYNDILGAPKTWVWVPELIIQTPTGPVFFCHTRTGSNLSNLMGMSCVRGHEHSKAQVVYTSTPERLLFDMVVGCLIDKSALAFAYNKITAKRPIISVGIILNGIPQIIPMVLDEQGRWIGTL